MQLRVSVIDAGTGQPIATRVNFRGPSGEYLPPRGHTADVNTNWGEDIGGDLQLGATPYAYVPGQFELEAPVGAIFAEVVHGFEYTPLREMLVIGAEQAELRLTLQRWSDAREHGYFSVAISLHGNSSVKVGALKLS